ncbi:hypothetical protein [Limibacterium fermenti]|uniref:hypothetical protein n=1 Tax=Limibacterium fermenti TaxID=3229863 RepID=UPI003A6A04F0
MPVKQITPESRAICLRFVRAYEELRYRGVVKTKAEFAKEVGIRISSNLKRMETNPNYEPTLNSLYLLLSKFSVNPEWLFFGKGEFLEK